MSDLGSMSEMGMLPADYGKTKIEVLGDFTLGPLNLDFTKELGEIAEAIVIPAQVKRIADRENVEGGEQRKNAPSTEARKGHDHPLVEKGLLASLKSYAQKARPKEVRVFVRRVTARRGKRRDTPRNRVVDYLDDRGYRYFGLSEKDEKRIQEHMETTMFQRVKKALGIA